MKALVEYISTFFLSLSLKCSPNALCSNTLQMSREILKISDRVYVFTSLKKIEKVKGI
jgi:hypothetical protein